MMHLFQQVTDFAATGKGFAASVIVGGASSFVSTLLGVDPYLAAAVFVFLVATAVLVGLHRQQQQTQKEFLAALERSEDRAEASREREGTRNRDLMADHTARLEKAINENSTAQKSAHDSCHQWGTAREERLAETIKRNREEMRDIMRSKS